MAPRVSIVALPNPVIPQLPALLDRPLMGVASGTAGVLEGVLDSMPPAAGAEVMGPGSSRSR
jgi:hypothetical protein